LRWGPIAPRNSFFRLAYDLHLAGDLEKQAEVFAHFGAVIDEEDSLCVFVHAHVTSMS